MGKKARGESERERERERERDRESETERERERESETERERERSSYQTCPVLPSRACHAEREREVEGVGAVLLSTLRCEDGYPHALIGGTNLSCRWSERWQRWKRWSCTESARRRSVASPSPCCQPPFCMKCTHLISGAHMLCPAV